MVMHTELEIDSVISRQNVAKEGWTTYYVDGVDGNDANNFLRWESAAKTIQAAIDKAGSWAKIYIKAGTYTEAVHIVEKESIRLIGEEKSTTIIISDGTFIPVTFSSYGCELSGLTINALTAGWGVVFQRDYNTIKDCVIVANAIGIWLDGCNYNNIISVKSSSVGTSGVTIGGSSTNNKVTGCSFSNYAIGVDIAGDYNQVYENEIFDCANQGVRDSGDNNAVYHNNLVNNAAQIADTGANNEYFENYYDDHVTDANNDGICDTPYVFVGGTDYSPVSKLNGWKQVSIGCAALGGGAAAVWDALFAAHVAAGTFGKLVQDINSNVLAIINERLVTSENSPSLVAEDETFRFAVTVIDNDSGPIALADITAGTYDLHRIRAGVETTIAAGVAFSKLVGLVYADISFATADWDPDDAYLVLPNFDTTVVIGGNIYYVPMTGWSGLVHNLTNIEGKIDTLTGYVGYEGATSLATKLTLARAGYLDILNTDSKYLISNNIMGTVLPVETGTVAEYIRYAREMIRGHAQTRIGLIIPDLSNIGTDTPNSTIFSHLEHISTANYIDQTEVDNGEQNWLEYDIIVVGSDANYAFVLVNIGDLVTLKIPIIVVSSAVAQHMNMGTAIADSAATTDLFVETRGERVMELVFGATGDQTIFDLASVSARLNMGDAQLIENLLATQGGGGDAGDNTKAVIGDLPYSDGSGDILSLDDGTDLPAGRTFAGCFLRADNLNTLGAHTLLERLTRNITQSTTTPSLELKANAAKINRIWGETYAKGLAQGGGSVASNAQLDSLTRAIADVVRAGGTGDLAAILAETDKLSGGEYVGTVSAGTAVKTLIKEITTTKRIEIKSIWLDLTNLVTAGATIELEHKIDAANYKVFETDSWALTDDDGVLITGFTINNDFKISITGGEGAGVVIPYNIIYKDME